MCTCAFSIQGCNFSGKDLNSGPSNLLSCHVLGSCANEMTVDDFQAYTWILTGDPKYSVGMFCVKYSGNLIERDLI